MLSVIAASHEVEAYVIDKDLMEFFPERIQKQIQDKLALTFEPDRPYMFENVQKIKDKFREWDIFKVRTVQASLKNQHQVRLAEKGKTASVLDR